VDINGLQSLQHPTDQQEKESLHKLKEIGETKQNQLSAKGFIITVMQVKYEKTMS